MNNPSEKLNLYRVFYRVYGYSFLTENKNNHYICIGMLHIESKSNDDYQNREYFQKYIQDVWMPNKIEISKLQLLENYTPYYRSLRNFYIFDQSKKLLTKKSRDFELCE